MTTAIIILVIVLLLGLGGGAGAWFIFRRRRVTRRKEPATQTTPKKDILPFHWSYIILPVAILLLSIILSAYFYRLLPHEVAYYFKDDGTPDKWLSREMMLVWGLIPQIFLTLLAGTLTWGVTKLGPLFKQIENTLIKPEGILLFMGNIIALPQIVLCFVMFDIFSYNSYQTHIIPMQVFLLAILGLATISLGVFLTFALSKARQQATPQSKD